MGQALQTRIHAALAPLQQVLVGAVDAFAVQLFKDLDMECGLRYDDVVVLTDKFVQLDAL